MRQRFSLIDARVIGHYLGTLLVFEALAMVVPLVIALAFGEWQPASRYLFSAGVVLTAGSLMRLLRVMPGSLNRQQAIAVTGFAWIFLSAGAAIPLALSDHFASYGDALFDSVSALTTTDVSIVRGMDHLSYADNMWRFVLNVAGGLGLVVVAMSFGLFGRSSSSSLFVSEGRSEHVVPNVVETGRFIFKFTFKIVLAATLVIGAILIVAGMSPARAFLHGSWLAMSGFMTAGLTPMSTSVIYYHSALIELILCVLMVFGCLNFTLHREVARGKTRFFFQDIEVRAAVVWWTICLVVLIFSMTASKLSSDLPTLMRTGLFNFVSAATTTGFITMNSNQLSVIFPSGATLVLALAMSVGGSAGSTTGGMKLRRIAVVILSAFETMRRVVSTASLRTTVSYHHIGRRILSESDVKEAMTVFILFAITYAIGALAGVAYGYDALSAISESVAMASNSGITTGISAPDMPGALKVIYTVQMWAGRLEFVTLLALGMKIVSSITGAISDMGKAVR